MLFIFIICVATDQKYSKIPNFVQPFYIGFSLLAMGIAYGANSGYG
jgi:glycerol uptake facilitator-like aquaporin